VNPRLVGEGFEPYERSELGEKGEGFGSPLAAPPRNLACTTTPHPAALSSPALAKGVGPLPMGEAKTEFAVAAMAWIAGSSPAMTGWELSPLDPNAVAMVGCTKSGTKKEPHPLRQKKIYILWLVAAATQ